LRELLFGSCELRGDAPRVKVNHGVPLQALGLMPRGEFHDVRLVREEAVAVISRVAEVGGSFGDGEETGMGVRDAFALRRGLGALEFHLVPGSDAGKHLCLQHLRALAAGLFEPSLECFADLGADNFAAATTTEELEGELDKRCVVPADDGGGERDGVFGPEIGFFRKTFGIGPVLHAPFGISRRRAELRDEGELSLDDGFRAAEGLGEGEDEEVPGVLDLFHGVAQCSPEGVDSLVWIAHYNESFPRSALDHAPVEIGEILCLVYDNSVVGVEGSGEDDWEVDLVVEVDLALEALLDVLDHSGSEEDDEVVAEGDVGPVKYGLQTFRVIPYNGQAR